MIPIEKIDWNAIRAEYIGGGISQRDLARKHGIPVDTLLKRANKESWKTDRDKASNRSAMIAQRKIAVASSNNAEIAARIKAKLLRKLEREIDALPDMIGSETKNSVVEKSTEKGKATMKEATKAYKLRDLAAAYRDLTADMQIVDNSTNPLLQSLLDLERRSEHD